MNNYGASFLWRLYKDIPEIYRLVVELEIEINDTPENYMEMTLLDHFKWSKCYKIIDFAESM